MGRRYDGRRVGTFDSFEIGCEGYRGGDIMNGGCWDTRFLFGYKGTRYTIHAMHFNEVLISS
jgi:hypothetical protein